MVGGWCRCTNVGWMRNHQYPRWGERWDPGSQCFLRQMISDLGPRESFGLMSQRQKSSVCMDTNNHPIHPVPSTPKRSLPRWTMTKGRSTVWEGSGVSCGHGSTCFGALLFSLLDSKGPIGRGQKGSVTSTCGTPQWRGVLPELSSSLRFCTWLVAILGT